jgi:RNA polymerase sigma-70 factor (sigma-E family)
MEFEEYAQHHQVPLLRFATTLTADPRLAEEVVQDVLLRAFQRWDFIGELERPHAYVRRMVVNEHLSWRRRWGRVEPRADVLADSATADPTGAHADRAALIGELAALPKRHRAVLAMRYFEDLPDAEIAETLGCSAATVRSIASRALARLRVQMTDETPGPPLSGQSTPRSRTTTIEETVQ